MRVAHGQPLLVVEVVEVLFADMSLLRVGVGVDNEVMNGVAVDCIDFEELAEVDMLEVAVLDVD